MSQIRERAKAEGESILGTLRSVYDEGAPKRPIEQQTLGGLLFEFYRVQVARRAGLIARLSDLNEDERKAKQALDEVLDAPPPISAGLIARIEEETTSSTTGDRTLDGWYDALDLDEVPDELWGPKGPPDGWVRGIKGWRAPPGWTPPERPRRQKQGV